LNIEEMDIAAMSPDDQLLLIDESLERLEREDPESAQVVMLKFFTGLTNKEAARTLGVSESTVERQWAFAKACLFQMIRQAESGPGGTP
jgi:DNA-directed RNA polymerase specialized sigma24 family protein